jgi:anaerobic selenocysteine-containing dehydrogenase
VNDGDAIRIYNQRGEMHARARVTDDVPPGTVWMRDGWLGLNTLTDGAAVIPDEMVEILGFSGDQAGFDAEWKSRPPGLTASLR